MGRRLFSLIAASAAVVAVAGCGSDSESPVAAAKRAGVEFDENERAIAENLASSRDCDELTVFAIALNQTLVDTEGDPSIPEEDRAPYEVIEDIVFDRIAELGCDPVFRQVGTRIGE